MNIKNIFLGSLLLMGALVSCNDDDDTPMAENFGGQGMRVKSIVGTNKIWGDYELEFNYREDGRIDRVWRFDQTAERDTTGYFSVNYDVDIHEFSIYDLVLNIDVDSVKVLEGLYPTTIADTLKKHTTSQLLYSVKREKGEWEQKICRPRRNVGHGSKYNPSYINVSGQLQRLERVPGTKLPAVIRTNEEVYGEGGENDKSVRTVLKYEFAYDGGNLVSGSTWLPDSFSDTSWSKYYDFNFNTYSGVLVSVDCDSYKMRRSGNKVVVAEPGRNITYTLNERGLAVKIETTDGESATVVYEEGNGNFSELYAMPLDEALGKVWVR